MFCLNKNNASAVLNAAAAATAAVIPRTNETASPPPNNNSRYQRLPAENQPSIGVVKLNEEQIAKLNSELDIVENNAHILNEILNEFQSSPKVNDTKSDEDLNLLQVRVRCF